MAETEIAKTSGPEARGFHPLASFRQEVDRLFDSFFPDFWSGAFPRAGRGMPTLLTAPRVDVSETDKAYVVTAELPGMDEKDVQVELRDGMLTIQGEKKAEKEEKTKEYHLTERSYGSFRRAFQLPDTVDVDHIDAAFAKGVLTINLTKLPSAQAKAKKIDIRTS
jgi:HSP20 family protein